MAVKPLTPGKGKGKGKNKPVNVKDSRTIGQMLLQSALSRPMNLAQITRQVNKQVGADRKSALAALGTEASISRPFQQAGVNQAGITGSLIQQMKDRAAYTARLASPTLAGQMGALDASGRATGVAVGAAGGGPTDITPALNAAAVPILQRTAFDANAAGAAIDPIAARAAYDAKNLAGQQVSALDKWRQNVQSIREQTNASRQKLIAQMQGEAFQQRMGNANLLMGLYNTASGQEDLANKLTTTMRGQDIAAETAANAQNQLTARQEADRKAQWARQSRELEVKWWKARHPAAAGSGLPAGVRQAMTGIGDFIAKQHAGVEQKLRTGRTWIQVEVPNASGSGPPVLRKEAVPQNMAGKPEAIRGWLMSHKGGIYGGQQFDIKNTNMGPVYSTTVNSRNRAKVAGAAYAQYKDLLTAYGIDPATIRSWIASAMSSPLYHWS